MRLSRFIKTIAVVFWLLSTVVVAQEPKAPNYTHVRITLTAEGGPCGCVYFQDGRYVSCCPKYSVTVDENGTVIYNGVSGVKTRGERVQSIPISTVRDVVADFYRIDFFSLQDRYEAKKLPNGNFETIDHSNAMTVSIDIDGKTKSVYIFYGAPQELTDLLHKIADVMQIAQYVGRA
jgi:hypothetical protein